MVDLEVLSDKLDVRLKVKDFFSLSEREYSSPLFSFANHSWCLEIDPWNCDHFAVFLKKKSHGASIRLNFTFTLVNFNGTKVLQKHHTHTFQKNKMVRGSPVLISRCELLKKTSELVPYDVLTLICTLEYGEMFQDVVNQVQCAELLEDTGEDTASSSPEPPQTSKILQDFKELFLRKENCDVVIKVQEQEFPAHRAILAARSPVFAKTFQSDMKEKTTGIVNVEDCNPSAFSDFLCYLYCEDTGSLSSENVFGIFTAADKYDVPDLKAKCLKFVEENLSVDTFCDTIALALLHTEVHLIRVATDFFIQNALQILETVKWQSFAAENPTQSNELFIKYVKSVKHPVTFDNMN